MLRQKINASYSHFFLDTCAFDPKYFPEDNAAQSLWAQYEEEKINLLLSHSNQREIDHPNTPAWVKSRALSMIYTFNVPLTREEVDLKRKLVILLRGNAQSDKHKDDAHHLFQASKHGGYFITTDHRILNKHEEIYCLCTVQVLTPSSAIHRINLPDGS